MLVVTTLNIVTITDNLTGYLSYAIAGFVVVDDVVIIVTAIQWLGNYF